ncbi:Structural maintenance of chromosome complex subunit SmcA [Penicillium macrosclerotiorum]|uniref:Structural maintenance of chromosome complex subunit SmcA n=1 Tax=Penicillium macrosclerotiorum TaxID=303699 RepID=UPI002549930A|nr:Structural maintenance of chromosome complex subunit SmcA [Penicillium macrosclerotiorum]KAJ5699017.1 Structural maintenance of chromosome complex subunit SmcA [Penicillium macrosclerotiorum]
MSTRPTRLSTGPRRRSRSELEDDSDGADTHQYSASPPSSKRPRLNPAQEQSTADHDDVNDSDSTSSSEDSIQRSVAAVKVHHEVGPGGYRPGAIVRIKVTDFVTYNSAEFHPGPKLNMVIGPNGTGKSTLVCAICLGLGGSPQLLGRAKDLGEFVKHGCREATIEIELAGPPKVSRNIVICRNIKRDGNKSSFTINGASASRSKVQELAREFAIQVDNLCQFLPQDRVAEFAALSPVELLLSTQKAAGGREMEKWHEHLRDLRSKQKELQMSNQGDRETLANLEGRQEDQRADVERMRERAQVKQKVELLEFCRPLVEYREHHRAFEEIRSRKARVEQEHEQLKADLEPAMRAVTAKQTYLEQIIHVRDYRKQRFDQLSQEAKTSGDKIEELEGAIKDLAGQIEAERKSGQTHRAQASTVQTTIHKLRRQQEEEAIEFDPDIYNEKLRENRLDKRELESQASEILTRRQPLVEKELELKRLIEDSQKAMEHLDSQSGQQEAKLQRLSNDSLKAYRWVQQNQHLFEMEVFGPPIVTCSVANPKYADAIETLLQRNDFTAFTVQSRSDFRTLQRALNGQLKLHDISIKTCSISLDSIRSPLPQSELQRLGFDGWAKDFLNGPGPVLAALCLENRLHQTPIGLNDISEDRYNEMESGNISCWVSGKQSYQVTRRQEYNASSTRVRQVRPARYWTAQPVDASLKQQYLQNIGAWKQQMAEVSAQMNDERATMVELKRRRDLNEEAMRAIESEKAAKQTAYTQYRAIPEKLAQQEAKLKSIQKLFEEVRDRVGDIRDRQDQLSIEKAEATIKYADSAETLRQTYEELIKIEIRYLEASSDLKTLKQQHSEGVSMLEQKSREVKQAMVDFREGREKARTLMRKAHKTKEEVEDRPGSEEVLAMLGTADYFLDNLNADIDAENARLELTHTGSHNLIKEFEDRERLIQKLQQKLAGFHARLTDLDGAIQEIRALWEPKLDTLISKISDAFSDSFARIGCAGQVSLDKVEAEPGLSGEPGGVEFDQWSIQIHVKFREHEQLSILDSHRQSGGERAVSTIFYLMALQSLSASPFRVVDEINQGMDPRNERMVHGRLVEIACSTSNSADTDEANPAGGSDGGQYFLVTPKLLSGLVYRPGMRVLCIYSGEHMPKDYQDLDFGKAIRTMKALKSGRLEGNSQVGVHA